jgi:hypothetical protein
MWEYRWTEIAVGESGGLDLVGREGWEAVGVTSTGVSFGKPYVAILMKRPLTYALDLVGIEKDAAAYAAATAAADRIESHWSQDEMDSVVPGVRVADADRMR